MEIFLRDVVDSDLPIFFEHQADPESSQMAAFPSRNRDTFMAHWQRILADESNIIRTIVYNGQVAGNLVSFLMENKREVGYWIGREFWGRGVATKALSDFLSQVKIRPLYGVAARHNIGSQRVLEKCGFKICREQSEEVTFVLE